MNRKSVLFTVVAIVLVFGFGAALSLVLLWTGPETVPEDKAEAAKIVQDDFRSTADVFCSGDGLWQCGSVKEGSHSAPVTGQVIWQSDAVIEGGVVREGDALIRIDPNDYKLALAEMRADLEQARFEREVESGRQVIAKREWNELRPDLDMKEVNRSLVLREPHLRRAEAMLRRLKTTSRSPSCNWPARLSRPLSTPWWLKNQWEVGQLLDPGSQVCELVGSDEFWIEGHDSVLPAKMGTGFPMPMRPARGPEWSSTPARTNRRPGMAASFDC